MSDEIILTGYAEDSEVKKYIQNVMMPLVFHDIPITTLNTGAFSIINEYMSQAMENLAFTSSFYFNEAFITKAVLPDSIYSEAAIFNIGYAFATPSSCNFLLELKIEDIVNNSKINEDTGMMEFILDKDTKFNLSNGNVYSLDYDICISYKNISSDDLKTHRAWDIHYIMDNEQNSIAINKNSYIMHRVTDIWLCLMINASEITREYHTVINTTVNGIPNVDTVISTTGHICGFDIKYIDSESKKTGVNKYIATDHVLPIHTTVNDRNPYVHYIMDNSQTIRFMWQLNGTKYFNPEVNSSFEIVVYTSHGSAANFTAFNNMDQPYVISSTKNYPNNGNVMKAAFVISGSMGGTDIGNAETVRRMTIEAYNTANQIDSDHDLDEYFKTFYFKNALFPFFFKRRDDPWGRIWSGSVALKDDDDYIFKTNTLHAEIPYNVLYSNNDNTVSANEVIIPPGWVWKYKNGYTDDCLFTVEPYCQTGTTQIELAKNFVNTTNEFSFVNPFGIRIQKEPFAIGYFNPWINKTVTANALKSHMAHPNDIASIYHAFPILTNIQRTYSDNFYRLTSFIVPTVNETINHEMLVINTKNDQYNEMALSDTLWLYFKRPINMYDKSIPFILLNDNDRYKPFDPENTYVCATKRDVITNGDSYNLGEVFIIDNVNGDEKRVPLSIIDTHITSITGSASLWGSDRCKTKILSDSVVVTCDIKDAISETNESANDLLVFEKVNSQNYYTLRLAENASAGRISKVIISNGAKANTKLFQETQVYAVSSNSQRCSLTIKFDNDAWDTTITINNAQGVFIPYDDDPVYESGEYIFDFSNTLPNGIILYATMNSSTSKGKTDYYYIKMADIDENEAVFHINNNTINMEENVMRVILHASLNGIETGRTEMIPILIESDGSYRYEAQMHPLNMMVDIDNRINIASRNIGGGSWTQTSSANVVVDATNPEFKISILMKSDVPGTECEIGHEYDGYIVADTYKLEDISLVQELKEMRSVVTFGDTSVPSEEEIIMYNDLINMMKPDTTDNLFTILNYADDAMRGNVSIGVDVIKSIAVKVYEDISNKIKETEVLFKNNHRFTPSDAFDNIELILTELNTFIHWDSIYHVPDIDDKSITMVYVIDDGNEKRMYEDRIGLNRIFPTVGELYIDIETNKTYIKAEGDNIMEITLVIWSKFHSVLNKFGEYVEHLFTNINIHSGLTIQLVPFVESSLINSQRFPSFVSAFTEVHKAMEPVIMHKLEGNSYLDCKLIATYGKPHSYTTEYHKEKNDKVYWPDLSIQMEFDIAFKNQSLATDTIDKLRGIVKSYFAKITNIHTATERLTNGNNIYISELLRLMLNEKSDNVAYLKFVGWYTNERNNQKSTKYMDANVQSIVQKWQKIDNFPEKYLESFVPEMFTLEDSNIVFNIL